MEINSEKIIKGIRPVTIYLPDILNISNSLFFADKSSVVQYVDSDGFNHEYFSFNELEIIIKRNSDSELVIENMKSIYSLLEKKRRLFIFHKHEIYLCNKP